MYAHVPRIPSVDVDLYLQPGTDETAREVLEAMGLTVAPGGEVELLDLEARIDVWGTVPPGLGLPDPGYVPAEVLAGHREGRRLELAGSVLETRVPDPPALAVTKAVALANRDLAYRAHGEGRAGMLLGPALANHVRGKARSYWERKAGKDLVDLALLLDIEDTPAQALALLVRHELLEPLRERLPSLHDDTITFGQDLAQRQGLPTPHGTVRRWLEP